MAVKFAVFPIFIDKAVLFNDILSTSITGSGTVILQVAVFPLEVFAVMVAVPTDFAVTFPFDTVATFVLLDFQVTVLSVAFVGVIVAVKFAVLPTFSDKAVLFSDILEASTTGSTTVTLQVAVFPFTVFAVIIAVPSFIALTFPFDTVTILLSLDCQVTVLSVVSSGIIVAFKM